MHNAHVLVLVILLSLPRAVFGEAPPVTVAVHSEVPTLLDWAHETRSLLVTWHPRIDDLLRTKGFSVTHRISLNIEKSDEGVAETSDDVITVFSHWIEKHPADVGLAVHELVHVIQAYPSPEPSWITEGIADYIRFAIFEEKPQSWFPVPAEEQGYKAGYRGTAGFLLWLESDTSQGIVKTLNTAMRSGTYSDELFKSETGFFLDELWQAYRDSR